MDPDDIELRFARPEEAAAISELALRSKAVWGYDTDFLREVPDELTTRPEQCDGVHTVVAARGEALLGYFRLDGKPPRGELADLFVDPAVIGTGLGGRLLRDAVQRAQALGMTELTIDSDPYAEEFYLHMGAVRIGLVPSGSVQGRELPQLSLPTSG